MVALEGRLAGILRGTDTPKDHAERLDCARLCYHKRLFAASARFAESAFAARPGLAGDLESGRRYQAACAAARAGTGLGEDDPPPDAAARARLRSQSLAWLRADLAAWAERWEDGSAPDRERIGKTLLSWQADPDLAAVRDADALRQLPEEERQGWEALWAEVRALRRRVRETRPD